MKKTVAFFLLPLLYVSLHAQTKVSGTVTCDGLPLEGVQVSDGRNMTVTDVHGRYELTADAVAEHVFMTTPSGYVPVSHDGLTPTFFARIAEGESVQKHDFMLQKEDQSSYSVIFVTDLHLTGADFKPDIESFRSIAMPNIRKQARKARRNGPVYTFNLGDLSHERYWYQFGYNLEDAYRTLQEADYPTLLYSVPGNHDNDSAVRTENTDRDAGHLYRKVLGPEYYSVNIGGDHWLFMDDIIFENGPFRPGKVRAVGAAGSLSYSKGFTKAQMEWLDRDLSHVPDDARVFICTHSPIISDNRRQTTFREGQMDTLSTMFSRFGKVMIWCGHMHRTDYLESDRYPGFESLILTATSGDMWESEPDRVLGIEGEDGGVCVAQFSGNGYSYDWYTHHYGRKAMRVYDMNSVRDHYLKDEVIRAQMEAYPLRTDFADGKFKDMVMVNYWMYREGEVLQILENGVSLEVEKVDYEDPLFNISYYLDAFLGKHPVAPSQKTVRNRHCFAAKASTSDADVLVRVLDRDGNMIRQEKIRRPKAFGHDMK